LRDETERQGAAYRRALAAARRNDIDDMAALDDAPDAKQRCRAALRGAMQRYAAASDDLDRLCAAAECGFGDELVAMALTAPGREMITDAALAAEAEHLWRCSDAA